MKASDPYVPFKHLWSSEIANTTASRKAVAAFLEATGGNIMLNGRLRDIKVKHLGAGVYRVSTEEQK